VVITGNNLCECKFSVETCYLLTILLVYEVYLSIYERKVPVNIKLKTKVPLFIVFNNFQSISAKDRINLI